MNTETENPILSQNWNIPFYKIPIHTPMFHRDSESVPSPCSSQPNVSAINPAINIMVPSSQSLSESIFHDTNLITEIGIGIWYSIYHEMNRKQKSLVYFPTVVPFFLLSFLFFSSQLFSTTQNHKTLWCPVNSLLIHYLLFGCKCLGMEGNN